MRKQKLTQKEAARLIRNCGRTLVVRDGEFIVKLHGKGLTDKSTYFTNDLEDAVHTAKLEWDREVAAKKLPIHHHVRCPAYASIVSPTPMCTCGVEVVVKIEYWWDRLSRNWILQAKDREDNQIGAAEYAANSHTLHGALEAMRAQYPNVACVKS